ncbi:unnamed protein product [Ectocarpus sp. 12 AP-2014]
MQERPDALANGLIDRTTGRSWNERRGDTALGERQSGFHCCSLFILLRVARS